jgi:integrase
MRFHAPNADERPLYLGRFLASLERTVAPNRMKAGREHRVPLSPRAVAILRQLQKLRTSDFVFAGQARDKPLSNMAMEMVLRRMTIQDATVHGFRSSFRV